jgi:sarcosine oxidase gamma subunit
MGILASPWLTTVLLVLFSSGLSAQSQVPTAPGSPVPGVPAPGQPGGLPPRDAVAGPESATGTGIIRGQVVALETGRPLSRVQVRAQAQGPPPLTRVTITDDDGRFELAELPAREFTVTASRGGYVTLQYGQRRPFEPGRPITLAAGETIGDIRFALPRGGVIAGQVVDEFGEPVTGATVQVSRYRFVNGERVLASVASSGSPLSGGTDDRGEFRVFGLPPGDYFVSAELPAPLGALASTDRPPGYMATYYPGAVSVASAEQVRVGVGGETGGIAIALLPSRTATLSGVVVDPEGRPVQAQLSVRESVGGTGFRSRGAGTSAADGTFSIPGLPPGEYTVEARLGSGAAALSSLLSSGSASIAGVPSSVGSIDVVVTGADLPGLLVQIATPVTVSGRVLIAGAPPPEGLIRPADVRMTSVAVPRTLGGSAGTATVAADWTFEMQGLTGRRRLQVQLPSSWSLRRILHTGQDITDSSIDFSRGGLDGVVVELTQEVTTISGRVTDARGDTSRDFAVIVFADDPERWAPPSRYIRAVRPDQSGEFHVRGLPPGRYNAVALDYLEDGAEADRDRLERIRQSGIATSINLQEGETRALALRLYEGF